MNNYRDVIKAPIITEKSATLKENGNVVVFSVDPKANKVQIKKRMYNFAFDFDVKGCLGINRGIQDVVKQHDGFM